jgi:hypothetical protein
MFREVKIMLEFLLLDGQVFWVRVKPSKMFKNIQIRISD